MSAYGIRFTGKTYVVYRIDGNATVASYESGSQAQVQKAIMEQRWSEQQGKKKAPDNVGL